MAPGGNRRPLDPGTKVILGELRDLRIEMRADRRQAAADRQQATAERRQADQRFEQLIREVQQDSARREAATQRAFRDIRVAGLLIVRTLNRHTRLLERIDRKLGARGNGHPGPGDGRAA